MGKLFKLVDNKTGYYNIFATYEKDLLKCAEKILNWYKYMDTEEGVEDLLLGILEYEPYFHIIKLGDYKLETIKDFENYELDEDDLNTFVEDKIATDYKCINRLDFYEMIRFEEKLNERL
jgi:hypothetical protein